MKTCFRAIYALCGIFVAVFLLACLCIWQDARDWWRKPKGKR